MVVVSRGILQTGPRNLEYTTSRRRGLCQANLGGRCSWTTEQRKTKKKVDRRRQAQHGGLTAQFGGREKRS